MRAGTRPCRRRWCSAGEIAVTPMHFDLTDIAGMNHLERRSLADLLEADPAVRPA